MINTSAVARLIRRESVHLFHALNPASRLKAARWENSAGMDFMRAIGVKENDIVVDFGCGPGKFCVPAARVVGAGGRVYAVDKNPVVLKKVRRKADALGLQNLHAASSLAELMPWPKERGCAVALLYDILHFIDAPERRELYAALHGILAADGLLSVHMKHVKDNDPGRYFMTMSAGDVAREIESAGFGPGQRLPLRVWHSHDAENGIIWNFVKRSR